MHFIIDGYNVIGSHPIISLSDSDKEDRFVQWLVARIPDGSRDRFTVVFDGHSALHSAGRYATYGAVKVRYTYNDETADDVIIEMAGKGGGKVTVVSNDNHVKYHVKKKRIMTQSVNQFFCVMNQRHDDSDSKPEEEMDDYAISQWLNVFGEGGDA